MRRRGSLSLRIGALTAAVALITAVIAGVIGAQLIHRADTAGAQRSLNRLATELAAGADPTTPLRARAALRALKLVGATIGPAGAVTGTDRLARDALSSAEIRRVLRGGTVTGQRTVDGVPVLVAARPAATGGLVLVQRRADVLTVSNAVVRQLLLALVIAVVVAVALGVATARRLARPLRRTAAAAHALAAGERTVALVPEGPAEVAEVAAALATLSAHLATSEARQREFLLSVSHDLRTPLTAITGYAESLADGLVAADRLPQIGATLTAEAARLQRLVGDLLDLARLEAHDLCIDLVAVDLDDLLRAAGTVWADRCAAADVVFRVEREAAGLRLRTDPARLRQVLDGLLENALRVTPAGRPIVLAARHGAGAVVLEIRDGGPGLSDDDLAVAFDRGALYQRYRGIRQVGTGLGLAIVHRLVERLGGRIEAGHAAEGGARFTVWLPSG